jgi:glucose 1-dehydrogenase/3-oxoacyl-[acyl-carrier protein] reductase
MDLGIHGNTALVTASSSGIGLGCARSLSLEGANVIICGRDSDRLTRAKESLEAEAKGDILAIQADLTNPGDIQNLLDKTTKEFGQLDHIVTSAGQPIDGPFNSLNVDNWYDAYDTFTMSVVRILQAAHPLLSSSDVGSVVLITATAVKETNPNMAMSSSVRKSLIGLMKVLSFEWAPIRVNAILPGSHDTPLMTKHAQNSVDAGKYTSLPEALLGWADNPLNRIGTPQEIGDVVAFLSSPRAGYVTGTAIPVDGGRMRCT